ncbi:MAG: ornithine carbamoyltransferase [Candidatus Altiarchaeota archaeon]|nr:ornithine carbamoyltransferase [Candidatus Altiarchaeota archaeon]
MGLLSVGDFSSDDLKSVIQETARIKGNPPDYSSRLDGKTLVLLFEKPSTRTKVSFQAGMFQLGGNIIHLDIDRSQLSRGESIADTARILSSYTQGIAARVYEHSTLLELAENSSVPVINALSDLEHPCQAVSDLFTIYESAGGFDGIKVTYVGDGNNVCNSLILGCAMLGIDISVASPQGYGPDKGIVNKAGKKVEVLSSPEEAAKDADFLYTDVWVSIGKEGEKEERAKAFKDYQINKELLQHAKPGCRVMHCLPAHRGEEITADMINSKCSIIWTQAENKLHAQKAILLKLLG